MLRATYRRVSGAHQIIGGDAASASKVTVRVRAVELATEGGDPIRL